MGEEAYSWEEGHFDGVIRRYREMLVREGMWDLPQPSPSSSPAGEGTQPDAEQLEAALQKVYALLPPPSQNTSASPTSANPGLSVSPPPHLILHLLHLSSTGAIFPHVDNLDAFGHTIVGISLGGERIMHFKRTEDTAEEAAVADPEAGPSEFEVLLEPGSAYIQRCVTLLMRLRSRSTELCENRLLKPTRPGAGNRSEPTTRTKCSKAANGTAVRSGARSACRSCCG